jgi:hypothetical protein
MYVHFIHFSITLAHADSHLCLLLAVDVEDYPGGVKSSVEGRVLATIICPGRGYSSIARDGCARGRNPQTGIRRMVWAVAVHWQLLMVTKYEKYNMNKICDT